MTLRVLHIGNIANNAYNIAKALRQKTDIEADSFSHGFLHYISHPQWEDADIDPPLFGEYGAPDWSAVNLKGFQSPPWHFINFDGPARARNGRLPLKALCRTIAQTAEHLPDAANIARLVSEIPATATRRDRRAMQTLSDLYAGLAADETGTFTQRQWRRHLLSEYRRLLGDNLTPLRRADINEFVRRGRPLKDLFRSYDIIQAYGVWEPMYPMLLTPAIPRVTFEHGSMRAHPFVADSTGRLLALAYKTAFRNIITNADSIHAIRRLGLDNCTFIPHPVDDAKFQPRHSPVRERLLREHGCTRILLSPTRHNWQVKGNDTILRAFARRLETHGRGPKLFLADWGQEMIRSKDLATQLGIADSIVWLPPLPKRRLAEYLNASDLVLDQFVLGAFGTVTPEALACGVPVILYYRQEDHEWCFPQHPPVLNARTVDEVAAAIDTVLDEDARRRELSERGRQWYLQHHSIDVVVRRHVEIYNAIRKSPVVSSIGPEAYKETAVVKSRVLAVVRSRVALDAQERPKYLREVCGRPLINILADRLGKCPQIGRVVLVMDEYERATAQAAKKLGWTVVLKNRPRIYNPLRLLSLSHCTHLALFEMDHPFVDPEFFHELLGQVCMGRLDSARLTSHHCYGPSLIIRRRFATRAVMLKLLMRGSFTPWRKIFDTVLEFGSHAELAAPADMPKTELAADAATTRTIEALGGLDFTLADLRDFESDPQKQRRLLYEEMLSSPRPHLINAQLNQVERAQKVCELQSFPVYVGVNVSSYCNVRCRFCSYHPAGMKSNSMLTLEQFRRADWLKYVSRLSLFAGIGESLVNPEFPAILSYARQAFEHLQIDFFTNGKAISQELIDQMIREKVDTIHCSLNAATKETYDKLVEMGDFEHTVKMLRLLNERRKRLGAHFPKIGISSVLVRQNIDELPDFVRLAATFEPDYISACHYATKTTVGCRMLPESDSLYHHKDLSDQMFDKADTVAAQLGVNLLLPPKFCEPNDIVTGARVKKSLAAESCSEPWRAAYLTVDEQGIPQFIFCCSGVYYGIRYDRDELDEKHFRRLWNHKIARYFRRTVDRFDENPLCAHCCTQDRFEPGDNLLEIGRRMETIFAELA